MILVFGKSGKLAKALVQLGATCLGRADGNFTVASEAHAALAQFQPDGVINAAGFTHVDGAERQHEVAFRVNAQLPKVLAQACASKDLPFVNVSTDYVFDGSGQQAWTPQDRPNPLNTYGASKWAGEQAVSAHGGNAVNLRTAWVFAKEGPDFVSAILRTAAGRSELPVVADQRGGPTYVGDLAHACLKIVNHLKSSPEARGTYHFAGKPDVSRAEFARQILWYAWRTCTVQEMAALLSLRTAARPKNSALDMAATTAMFDLQPCDWRQRLAEILGEDAK